MYKKTKLVLMCGIGYEVYKMCEFLHYSYVHKQGYYLKGTYVVMPYWFIALIIIYYSADIIYRKVAKMFKYQSDTDKLAERIGRHNG